jgi:ankyrin repeat protein
MIQDQGRSLIHLFLGNTFSGDTQVLKLLCHAQLDMSLRDKSGQTPVFVACTNNFVKALTLFREMKVDFDPLKNLKNGLTPTWAAAVNGHVAVLEFFVGSIIDLETPNHNGCTPAQGAATNNQVRFPPLLPQDIAGFNPVKDRDTEVHYSSDKKSPADLKKYKYI